MSLPSAYLLWGGVLAVALAATLVFRRLRRRTRLLERQAQADGLARLFYNLPFIGIALSFAIWIVFAQLLKLSLPAGPLERLFF